MRKLIVGVSDLATVNPKLAKEWNYEKNGDLLPTMVTSGSVKKVWWKCEKGHEWQATVISRSYGARCPFCTGKKVLKGFNDLATVNPKFAKEWDYEKNGDLKPTMVSVGSSKKVWWKCKKGHNWYSSVATRNAGNNCPVCFGRQVLAGYNDLATKNPELAKEWNYEKNGELKPTMVTPASGKKVWWKCEKGHEWKTYVYTRNRGDGCPVCTGRKVLIGYNDLATKYPVLAEEWNYEKNGDLKPTMITSGSRKRVWWKCKKCGHEWQAIVFSRSDGRGCPVCAIKKLKN